MLPVGQFMEGLSPPLHLLKSFAEIYFLGMKVELLESAKLTRINDSKMLFEFQNQKYSVKCRISKKCGRLQLLVKDLLKIQKPKDAYCLILITMEDLYLAERCGFSFGVANQFKQVGVFSFARFVPQNATQILDEEKQLLFKRSCIVMAHEITHMFGKHFNHRIL